MSGFRNLKRLFRSLVWRIQSDAARLADLVFPAMLEAKPVVITSERFDAFGVLGNHDRLSDEMIKQRYHRIVREIHPDRLQALGASMGMIRKAESLLSELNQAYDAIARQRGLK